MVSEFDQPQNSNIIGISKEDNSITLPPLILGTDITKPGKLLTKSHALLHYHLFQLLLFSSYWFIFLP